MGQGDVERAGRSGRATPARPRARYWALAVALGAHGCDASALIRIQSEPPKPTPSTKASPGPEAKGSPGPVAKGSPGPTTTAPFPVDPPRTGPVTPTASPLPTPPQGPPAIDCKAIFAYFDADRSGGLGPDEFGAFHAARPRLPDVSDRPCQPWPMPTPPVQASAGPTPQPAPAITTRTAPTIQSVAAGSRILLQATAPIPARGDTLPAPQPTAVSITIAPTPTPPALPPLSACDAQADPMVVFKLFDADRDGALNPGELCDMLGPSGAPAPKPTQGPSPAPPMPITAPIDTRPTGAPPLSTAPVQLPPDDCGAADFKAFDADHDGAWAFDEYAAHAKAQPTSRVPCPEGAAVVPSNCWTQTYGEFVFKRADANGDGRLSADEFCALRAGKLIQ